MKNNIFCIAMALAVVSCLPSTLHRDRAGTRSNEFSIEPKGTWVPSCQDVAAGGALVAHQMRIVFGEQEPSFVLTHDFLSQVCKEDKPKVALHKQLKGKITLKDHSNLDDGRRARAVEVAVDSESYTPKSDDGLKYFRQMLSTEMGKQAAIDKELTIPTDHMRFDKLYGFLVVNKSGRNAIHVYLDPAQKNLNDIKDKLNETNLYVRHTTK